MITAPVTVTAPPSKSLSHRKLIAASLARGTSRLSHVLESDDTQRTMDVLQLAGVVIDRVAPGEYAVTGMGGAPLSGRTQTVSCFMGESGTSCRLLTAILAAGEGSFFIHGGPRLQERPMAELLETLQVLGSSLHYGGRTGFLPLSLDARGLSQAGDSWLAVHADTSSQFLSAMLLAAPLAEGGLRLALAGKKAVSWPYVRLTLQTLEESGCPFAVTVLNGNKWREMDWRTLRFAHPGMIRFRVLQHAYAPLTGDAAQVEGDYSGASYLLAAGALGPSPITVMGLSRESLQGDRVILDILQAMGAAVTWSGRGVTVSPGRLRGVDWNMSDCPDLVLTVVALACAAEGSTIIRGVEHLRGKESDRMRAPETEFAKIGTRIDIHGDTMVIHPPQTPPSADPVRACGHNDHRMAMSLALLELTGRHLILDDPECVNKSFPAFWDVWRRVHPATKLGAAAG